MWITFRLMMLAMLQSLWITRFGSVRTACTWPAMPAKRGTTNTSNFRLLDRAGSGRRGDECDRATTQGEPARPALLFDLLGAATRWITAKASLLPPVWEVAASGTGAAVGPPLDGDPPMSDPLVTVSIWRGPLSALAARQKMTPKALMTLISRHGLRRGANWEVPVSSSVAMATLQRVLNAETTE